MTNPDNLKIKSTKEKIEHYGFSFVDKSLTDNDITLKSKLSLVCKNGHTIIARMDNIIDRNKLGRSSGGCAQCHKDELTKQSLDSTLEHLNPLYTIESYEKKEVNRANSKTVRVYTIKCDNNHTFTVESGQFKHKICPKCTETIFLGQERTRSIFEHLFGVKFIKTRPDFLQNPQTKLNLELDGFNEKLNMAFEFHGNQHFSDDTEFGGDYEKQAERDKLKVILCQKNHTKLIEIIQPKNYNFEKFTEDVLNQIYKYFGSYQSLLQQFKINTSPIKNTDLNIVTTPAYDKDFRYFVSNICPIKDYSVQKEIVSNHADSINMTCPDGHVFQTTPYEFKNNSQGKKGREIPCKTCYELKFGKVNTYTIPQIQEIGKKQNLILKSTVYVAINEPLIWVDENNNEQTITLRQVIRRVPKNEVQIKENKYTIEEVIEAGKKQNLTLKSTEYEAINSPLVWLDENNNEQILTLRQVIRRVSKDEVQPIKENKYTIDKVIEAGQKQNLTLKSTEYKDVNSPLVWLDDNNNEQTLTLRQVLRRVPINEKQTTQENKYTLDEVIEAGKKQNLTLKSTEYKSVNSPLVWVDENNNEQTITLRQVLRRVPKNKLNV